MGAQSSIGCVRIKRMPKVDKPDVRKDERRKRDLNFRRNRDSKKRR